MSAEHGEGPTDFERLVQENLGWAVEYVRRRLQPEMRGDADSLDFVQEAILSLHRGPALEVKSESEFRALLSRVLDNDLRDRHRYLHRQCRDVRRAAGGASDTLFQHDPPAHSITSPSMSVDRSEREAWIRLALEFLSPEDRQVLRLREWEELSFEEIGKQLGVSADAARVRYHRALPKLARKVAGLRRRST